MTKTISLETAKRLKEAGWAQEGATRQVYSASHGRIYPKDKNDLFASPSCDELLDALPACLLVKETGLGYSVKYANGIWIKGFREPAEALAALWLQLRKQGTIRDL
jgi:hypothetical protein